MTMKSCGISDPRVDRDLAKRVLGEVQGKAEVFIGMNVTLEMEEMLREEKLGKKRE